MGDAIAGQTEIPTASGPIYTYKGELDITFSNSASLCVQFLEDYGSAAAVCRPEAPAPDAGGPFSSPGDVLVPDQLPPGAGMNWSTGQLTGVPVAMVRNHPGGSGQAVVAPTAFSPIYDEHNQTTLWTPGPPDGYVALGLVATGTDMNAPPALSTIACIRKDLVGPAESGARVWESNGDQGPLTLFAITLQPPASGEINVQPGTFFASDFEPAPFFSLRLPAPTA